MTFTEEIIKGCGNVVSLFTGFDNNGKSRRIHNADCGEDCGDIFVYCSSCKSKAIGYKKAIEDELKFLEEYSTLLIHKGFNLYVDKEDKSKPYRQLVDGLKERIAYLKNELKLLEGI